jgi:putative Mg2+ transporter-C (MgtC) family protein
MLVGMSVIESTDGEARVIQVIITGIGFIGGRAILKDQDKVAGTASAASIWNTGAIGLAVAFDRYEIAILLAALNFLSLLLFGKIKKEVISKEKERELIKMVLTKSYGGWNSRDLILFVTLTRSKKTDLFERIYL